MRDILEIILGREVVLKLLPQTEKEQRSHPLNRYVRLDVWAMDEEDTVYNTEVQKENTGNLPKRSRFYQALIDSNLLAPGEVGFQKLNPCISSCICPFDLFGYGLYRYTFRMQCEEVPELSLKDDAVPYLPQYPWNEYRGRFKRTDRLSIDGAHHRRNVAGSVPEADP